MHQLRPSTRCLWQKVESCNTRSAEKLIDSVGGKHDVNILGDTAMKPMAPDGPASANDGLATDHAEQVIQRPHNPTIPAGQVLWFKHAIPAGQEFIRQCQLLGQ
jgi:hypothetical protein